MIKSIFFDYDGVLVDSFANVFKVYKTICRKLQLKAPENLRGFKKIYGYKYQETYKTMGMLVEDYPRAGAIFKKEIIKYNPRLFPGIKKLIRTLAKKYKLFLVSSNIRAEVADKLKKYNLTNYFTEVMADNEPEQFSKDKITRKLIKKYKLNKKQVVFIGDRNVDYDKALKIGLKKEHILLVEYGWGYDHKKIKMKHKIRRPLNLLKAIEKIDK